MAEVAWKNYFDILADPSAGAAPAPQAAEKPKVETPSSRGGAGGQRGKAGPRGGRYYQRGRTTGSAPREEAETEEAPREGKRSGEDRGRGRGKGGRGRGERGRGGHGRVFDRHSATGKTDTEKKISQGWGADEGDKELIAEEEGSSDAKKDASAETPADDPWGVAATGGGAGDAWGIPAEASGDAPKEEAPAESRRREEEEDNTLTLDQYLAQQKEKSTVPKLENVRQANDGADDLFKDAVPVHKDEDEDVYFASKTKTVKPRSKKAQKQVIEIDGQFSDRVTRGGRGGRGGERGARGGRGRGGRGRDRGDFQGGRNGPAPVSADDKNAFPELS